MRWGGLVLCGGRSERMGEDKARLPFGPETMLQRMLRLLREGLGHVPLAVAAAPGQQLPLLPPEVLVTEDEMTGCGPIEGLYRGLSLLSKYCDAAVVVSCDIPLLVPEVLGLLQQALNDSDAAVVGEPDGRLHPLCGVWRITVLEELAVMRANSERRLQTALARVRTVVLPAAELKTVDPELRSLWNVNDWESYQAAKGREHE